MYTNNSMLGRPETRALLHHETYDPRTSKNLQIQTILGFVTCLSIVFSCLCMHSVFVLHLQ